MRKLIVPFVVAAALVVAYLQRSPSVHVAPATTEQTRAATAPAAVPQRGESTVADAFAAHARDVEVGGSGTVVALLRDDDEGSRHQRFLLRIEGGPTVLVAHNIDLAPRVSPLRKGDRIAFRGEYIWNEKGGVLHWTHHDPSGRHEAGYLEREGQTFK